MHQVFTVLFRSLQSIFSLMSGLVFMSSVFIRSIFMLVLTTSELTLSSLDFVSIKSFLEAEKKSFYFFDRFIFKRAKNKLPSACFEKSVLRLVKSPFISSNLALVTVFMMLISVLVAKLCIVRSKRLEVDSSCAKRSANQVKIIRISSTE